MDKLKEVLKYQFWILLGVALILPFVGWIMGTSGMMSEAAARTTELKKLRDSLAVVPDDPNDTWSQQLSLINVEQEKQRDIAWRNLYELQKPKMVWPRILKDDADWPADDDPEKMNTRHMELYRQAYPGKRGEVGEVEKVRQIVKPIVDDDWQSGLVSYDPSLMPRPDEEWSTQAPAPKQIKAAQEDLWLLAAILECIAKVNEGAPNAYDAPIREINELLLRGGTKGGGSSSAKSAGSTSTGSSASMMGGTADMMKGMPSMMGGMRGADMGGGGGAADYKINPDEDLGPERPSTDSKSATASASSTTASTGTTGTMAEMMKNIPSGMGGMGGGFGGRSGGGSNMERYRDEQKEFKTRGFSLQVVMDHRRIPELLVALSNCEHWPITVLRLHEADYKDEDLVPGDSELSPSGRMSMPSGSSMRRGIGPGPMSGGPGMTDMMRGASGRSGGALPSPRSAPGGRSGGDGGEDFSATRSALDDPNLANVAIVGLIYIFNKPPDAPPTPSATQPTETQPVAGATPPAATPPTGAESAAAGADAAQKSDSTDADDERSDEKSDEKPDESADAKPASPPDDDARPGKSN